MTRLIDDRPLALKASTAAQKKAKQGELGWCVHCGEGVTTFCRSRCKNYRCPRDLPTIPLEKTP